MARVWLSRLLPLGVSAACGLLYLSFRRRVLDTAGSDEDDFCTSEFVWMNSTLWSDPNVFLTTLKIRVYPKTLMFCDERGSDTNCWWEKPLVVDLKHLEGIKHPVLFQNNKLIKYKQNTLNTHPLFLSSVSFFCFPHLIT